MRYQDAGPRLRMGKSKARHKTKDDVVRRKKLQLDSQRGTPNKVELGVQKWCCWGRLWYRVELP